MTARGLVCKLALAAIWAAGVMAPAPVTAQDWATPEVCDVSALSEFPEAQSDLPLEQLQSAAAAIPNGQGKFWRITAPNGAVSHLWGTFHSSNRFILDLPAPVLAEIKSARRVALEIDPVYKSRAAYERALGQPGYFRPAGSGFDFGDLGLPDTVETWISARLQAVGWGSSSIHYLSLGGLSEILLWSPCDDFDAGVIPNQDSYIQTLARIENVPVLGLEPPNRLIRHLNHPEHHALARAMVAVYGSYLAPMENSDGFAAHITLYVQGKIATSMVMDQEWTLNALGNEGPALYARLNSYLLDQRNHDFITAAEAALQEGGLFMGVGAYHLPGHQGVVELLRTKGYQVDRVPLPDETAE